MSDTNHKPKHSTHFQKPTDWWPKVGKELPPEAKEYLARLKASYGESGPSYDSPNTANAPASPTE